MKVFRENPDSIFDDLKRRNASAEIVKEVIKLDKKWRVLIEEGNKLRAERNSISKEIGELKKQADLSYDISVAKRNALERAESRQIFAYNGHLFRADAETICLVQTLKQHKDSFYILDTNNNPCEIKDPANFLNKLIERNQETLNAYHQINESFKRR